MQHPDHVALLRDGVTKPGGVWADLGCGTGAFTLALADLLGPGATIYAVDKNQNSLQEQARVMHDLFPAVNVHSQPGDFTLPLSLPPLDGILMSNSLHFIPQQDKPAVVQRIKKYLKPTGRLLVVEYNLETGNLWVPYPFPYSAWESITRQAGFANTRLLATHVSHSDNEFYAAMSSDGVQAPP